MTNRIYNFGAGPAMLPEPVLKKAQEAMLNWRHMGLSIMELGHRTPEFMELLSKAEELLRALLTIPAHYKILFLGGAARTQFSMIPMNLVQDKSQAAYLVTGVWSQMALTEAQKVKSAYCLASEEAQSFHSVPVPGSWSVHKDTAYIYYTPNETVNGVRFPYVPETCGLPLIADMTSCLLSEPIDINQYALIFAGAQKNIANAGLTLVIIREDLLGKATDPHLPTMMDYSIQAAHHSLYATPPVFNCYLALLMLEWVKAQGGVEALYQHNCLKANALYDYLDASSFYSTQVDRKARSLMNVCFSINNQADLEQEFVRRAAKQGLYALAGHKLVGGLRASLYNAMPLDGVEALIGFMHAFAKEQR